MACATVEAEVTPGLVEIIRFEHKWKIRNWLDVVADKDLHSNQNFVFETGKASDIESKWMIGLKQAYSGGISFCDEEFDSPNGVEISWKVLEVSHHPSKVQANLVTQLLRGDGTVCREVEKPIPLKEGKEGVIVLSFLFNFCWSDWNSDPGGWESVLDTDGSLTIIFKLTLLEPTKHDHISIKKDRFQCLLMEKMCTNHTRLLNDKSTADLKITTSDGQQLLAHRVILQAQCPVFATMFRSQFAESASGVVSVPDISGKTMEILLRCFYTGQLLNTWSDDDTIVEFTYAAGKYQLDEVLQMLDNILGTDNVKEPSLSDAHLLKLAHKLSLKNAETRLMKRVAKLPAEFTNELFELFGNNLNITDTLHGSKSVGKSAPKPTVTKE